MTSSAIAILTDPHPCAHLVFPCTDDQHIADAVTIFARAGLDKDEGVVIIATEDHCRVIIERLAADGFNIKSLQRTYQLICIGAADLLGRFMVDGMPDEKLFKASIEEIIGRAKGSAGKGHERKVRAFGEMVSLLWRVDTAAAVRLEELWNGVIEEHQLALLCTYSLDGVAGGAHASLPECLLTSHSSNLALCSA
jgi:hypothetical protein